MRRAWLALVVALTMSLAFTVSSDASAAAGTAPVVKTTEATNVTTTSATLTGTVNPGGLATTVWFQWGSINYTSVTVKISVPAGTKPVNVSIPITGLSPNTGYRFQTVAQNARGTKYAGPSTFTTSVAFTGRPLNNDASAGRVIFTFDDGPSNTTPQLVTTLNNVHVPAVFFDIGLNAQNNPTGVRTQMTAGTIQNHTWDHASMTGDSTGTGSLTDVAATSELTRTNNAIVAAGAPNPTLWRPPYGDINNHFNTLANNVGLRPVMPYGDPVSGNIVDSNDWNGLTAAQIVTYVTQGYTAPWYTGPQFFHGIQADTIISMHDDGNPATIASLQGIVDYMNAHHLGATSTMRPDATGGVLAFTDAIASGAATVNSAPIRTTHLGRNE